MEGIARHRVGEPERRGGLRAGHHLHLLRAGDGRLTFELGAQLRDVLAHSGRVDEAILALFREERRIAEL